VHAREENLGIDVIVASPASRDPQLALLDSIAESSVTTAKLRACAHEHKKRTSLLHAESIGRFVMLSVSLPHGSHIAANNVHNIVDEEDIGS
jgi:hypothetical protein